MNTQNPERNYSNNKHDWQEKYKSLTVLASKIEAKCILLWVGRVLLLIVLGRVANTILPPTRKSFKDPEQNRFAKVRRHYFKSGNFTLVAEHY